jgi:hypothetical protein
MRQQKNKYYNNKRKYLLSTVSVSRQHGKAENIRGMQSLSLFLNRLESCATALLPLLSCSPPVESIGWRLQRSQGSRPSDAVGRSSSIREVRGSEAYYDDHCEWHSSKGNYAVAGRWHNSRLDRYFLVQCSVTSVGGVFGRPALRFLNDRDRREYLKCNVPFFAGAATSVSNSLSGLIRRSRMSTGIQASLSWSFLFSAPLCDRSLKQTVEDQGFGTSKLLSP